jgi:uncharacterized protein (DUF2141 family)
VLLLPCTQPEAQTQVWTLTVRLQGVQSARGGELRCALFADAAGFPSAPGQALAGVGATGTGGTRTCTFAVPGPGTYAVAVMHDENGNDTLDRNFVGIPTEGWATSRNVLPRMRAPRFVESSFVISTPDHGEVLQMRY